MSSINVVQTRLANHLLGKQKGKHPAEVVGWLGAVQAQDYAAAKWALGLRLKQATDAGIEAAFNEGAILRTHVLRPTWHFVLPEDIGWMLELTAPRVKALMAHYDRKLELPEDLLARSQYIMARALESEGYLTREELALHLQDGGIAAQGQRLGHLVMHAELDRVLCSGPRRGKQFTYAHWEARVPKEPSLSREEAGARLALRYFTSHGPAQLKDFAWWSGLSGKEAGGALAAVQSKLEQEVRENKTYWFAVPAKGSSAGTTTALLLSVYDEYTISYKDRSDISEARDVERMITMGNALTSVMVLNGQVAGTWKKILNRKAVEITLNPFKPLNPPEQVAFEAEMSRFGKFIEAPVILK